MSRTNAEKLLMDDVLAGRVSRRGLLKRAAVLGLSAPVIASLLAACEDDEDDDDVPVDVEDDEDDDIAATDDDPVDDDDDDEPVDVDDDDDAAPGDRGGGGRLDLLWWQAVDILNPHLSTGTKDFDGSSVVYEALAYNDDDGTLIPRLAAEIPSVENETLDPDGFWVTWKLRDDVYWHDGEQFTADDVVFTYEYVSDEATGATTFATYVAISEIEAEDDFTVTIRFDEPTPGWFVPFVGANGLIIPRHRFEEFIGDRSREAPYNLEPVGTGPYKINDFRPGDTIFFDINEDYWDPGKPYFDSIEMKGGGDATSAARAVIVTGEGDWAWNMQVEVDILEALEAQGEEGFAHAYAGTGTERIFVNFADPWHEDEAMRSEPDTEHPFLTNHAIRNAIGLSIQRDVVAEELYGPGFVPTANNLAAPEWAQDPDLEWRFDLEEAKALLDEAGVVDEDGDGVREYNGHPLEMLYVTSINSIRQKNQEIVQDDLNSIGFRVELKSVDAAVYFSSDPGNPDTLHHFYADIQMFTNLPSTPYPANWVRRFHTDEMKTKANNYAGDNVVRWSQPELDEIIEQIATEMDPDEQERLFRQVNRITAEEFVEICIVHRGSVAAVSNDLAGYHPGPWRSDVWDIGNWYRE